MPRKPKAEEAPARRVRPVIAIILDPDSPEDLELRDWLNDVVHERKKKEPGFDRSLLCKELILAGRRAAGKKK